MDPLDSPRAWPIGRRAITAAIGLACTVLTIAAHSPARASEAPLALELSRDFAPAKPPARPAHRLRALSDRAATPRAWDKAMRSAAATYSTTASAPSVPYCYRGYNGQAVDPKPSGACAAAVGPPLTGAPPRGTVMIIAGGGFLSGSGYPWRPHIVQTAKVFRGAGFQTVAVEHTSASVNNAIGLGPLGYGNVIAWYDSLRYRLTQLYGPDHPLCVAGSSSAGTFALLTAVFRAPDCIITEAAGTDLTALPGVDQSPPPAKSAAFFGVQAFGQTRLAQWSPVSYGASRFSMPVAMAQLPDDKVTPFSQLQEFAEGRSSVSMTPVDPSGTAADSFGASALPLECTDSKTFTARSFAHMCVFGQLGITQESVDRWHAAEVAAVESVVR